MALLTVEASAIEPAWMTRPGTIGHALQQPDGTSIYLDAVRIVKNKPTDNTAYYVVGECFSRDARMIIIGSLPEGFKLNQTVDIEGTLTTLDNGYRAITNTTIYAYLNRNGNILYHGPLIKGILGPIPWAWKQAFVPTTASSMSLMTDGGFPGGYPDPLPLAAASFCSTIAQAKSQPDGTFIELQCHPIQSVSTGYFIMAEDGTSDTLKAYYSNSVSTTSRINKISGTMKTDSGQRILCVDSGSGFDPGVDQTGNVMSADSGSVAWAKTFADTTTLPAPLTGKVVSRTFSSLGYFYVQETTGSSGIRVNDYNMASLVAIGDIVDVEGEMSSDDGERVILASSTTIMDSTTITTVGANNRSLAGGDFNIFTPGAYIHSVSIMLAYLSVLGAR